MYTVSEKSIDEIYFKFRRKVLITFSFVGFVTFLYFSYSNVIINNLSIGFFELSLSIIVIVNLLFFAYFKKMEPFSSIILFLVFVEYILLTFTGGFEGYGLIWITAYPVIAYGLSRQNTALMWTVGMFGFLILVYVFQSFSLIKTAYTFLQLEIFTIVYLVILILISFLMFFFEKREQVFVDLDGELSEIRKKLEKNLIIQKTERAKIDSILEHIGEGLVVLDKRGKILIVNKSAKNLLQHTKEKLKGKDYFDALPLYFSGRKVNKKSHPITKVLIDKTIDNYTTSLESPVYLKVKYGKIPVVMNIVITRVDSKVSGMIIIIRDVTDNFRRITEKTEFVSMVSHQLKNPLTSIKWSLELLDQDIRMSRDNRDLFEGAKKSTDILIALVNDLLNVTRAEIKNKKLNLTKINTEIFLKYLVKEIMQGLDKKCKVIFDKDNEYGVIESDEVLLTQVFSNIISNSIRYSDVDCKIEIKVRKSDNEMIFSFKDYGIGIPKKEQHKIFSKFYRASNAVIKTVEGTGLGLYYVKKVVENLGGEVGFNSVLGKGAEFIVKLSIKN